MKFNKLDLNLLVALNALLTEKNISRAAKRIHLAQPSMSNALARLRAYFDDELLASSGRQLVLTPRAESLVEPVREVLMRIESTIATPPHFAPSTESRSFTMLVSDFTTVVFMPALLARLSHEAPGVRIDLCVQQDRPAELLEQGDADLLIIPAQYVSKEHPSERLFEEDYVCATWIGNTLVREQLTFDDYLACGHVVARYANSSRLPAFDGWFMERYGVERRVEVSAPSLTSLTALIVGTNRIATVHRRLAERMAGHLPIRLWEPPLKIPKFVQMLQWHKYRNNDPALSWLRRCALEVGKLV